MDRRKVSETLDEAYRLRDASKGSEEWGFYQEHVYRLRAERYRYYNINTKKSVRRRERRKAQAFTAEARGFQAESAGARRWLKRLFERI